MDRSVRRGLALIAIGLVVIAVILLVPKQHKKPAHPPNDDSWLLVSYSPDNKYGTYLGNGFISTRIMGDGVGSQDGKPLPCFMAGLYDDEKLIPTPTWSDLRFYDGKKQFKIDKDAPYKQTLDMRTGLLTTHATWRAGDKTLKGKIEVIVSRARPALALVYAELRPDFSGAIRAVSPLGQVVPGLKSDRMGRGQGDGSAIAFDEYITKHSGSFFTVARRLSCGQPEERATGKALEARLRVNAGKPVTVSSYAAVVGGKASSIWDDPLEIWFGTERGRMLRAQKAAWAKLWRSDIIIDGPRKDQQAIHSCMFYLLQSVREGSQWSIPPMGLSDSAFSGHVFWDADTWMFPALILQHPELARAIVDYRYNTLPGAIANAKASGYAGAEYAWESGYTGKEDIPPGLEYRYGRHIDGDVALAQWQY